MRYIQCLGEKAFSGWYTGSNGSGMKNEVIGTTCSMKKSTYISVQKYIVYIYRHATGTKGVDYKHLRQKTIHEAYRSLSST